MKEINKDNLKVAFVSVQQDAERVPPIGLIYLATYLRDKVGLKNENIRVFDKNHYPHLDEDLIAFAPDIIGLTAMAVEYGKVIRFAQELRPRLDAPFILGGVHISTLPESLHPIFDLGVINEGELILADLVELHLKEKAFKPESLRAVNGLVLLDAQGKTFLTTPRLPIANLDDIPVPDFHFAHPNYFRPEEIPSIGEVGVRAYVLTSRGCPYRCTFCSTAHFWGKMRFHSPDFTARLVKHFTDNFGTNYLRVLDDLFTVSAQRLRAIQAALIQYGVFDKFVAVECSPRANLMNDELCRAMVDIKIKTLNFGFESGSDRILKSLKVGTVNVEKNKQAIVLCRKYGLNVYGSLMYGVPGETIDDMEKTNEFIDFAIQHGASYIWSFVATPFPATPFWEIALQRGKVSNTMDWSKEDLHNVEDPLLLDDTVDRELFRQVFQRGRNKLRKLKFKLILRFALKNPFAAARMLLKEPRYYLPMLTKWLFRQ